MKALLRIFRSWLSLVGLVITAASIFAFILLFGIDLFAHNGNPYMGILAYVVAPGFFFLGCGIMALGWWIHRRHEKRSPAGAVPHVLTIDFSRARDWRWLGYFVAGTVSFLLVTAFGSYQTYHITESVMFCGQACHGPMKPEFTAYQLSPHARVACVECHVGPGAEAYFSSKLNGVRQLVCTITGDISRPIKTPVPNLRPAQETCEQCHWPQKFSGNIERTYHRFLADETNTPFTVRMLLKVGGSNPTHGPPSGIHWHVDKGTKVEYIPGDEQRLTIPWVRVTDAKGVVTEFQSPDFTNSSPAHAMRTMDCIDCHNRPAHRFSTPNDAVDAAMAAGSINAAIPWAKSNLVSSLIQTYSTEDEALQKIESTLRATYKDPKQADSLVTVAKSIFQQNIFPEMKADWRAYPDHSSHKNSAGCFRCHDGKHKTADGKRTLGASDCNSCHIILAQGSGAQLDQLNPRGHPFIHIDAEYSDLSCAECHTGAFPK